MTARRRMDYDALGHGYATRRRADPRIAARVHAALGDARTVLNVGAGAGSYEPEDRWVLAVEPSATMRAQRPAGAAPALAAAAEDLPFDDGTFDAAMATITIHHWDDPERGLRELRRVSRGPVAVLTFAIGTPWVAWFGDHLPEGASVESDAFPDPARIAELLGGGEVETVSVPFDCTDGFIPSFYGRPEAFLDPGVRSAQSVWARLPPGVEDRFVARLEADLASGAWDAAWGHLRTQPEFDGGLRLVRAVM
jgi:SAM-dependent methyltransferase